MSPTSDVTPTASDTASPFDTIVDAEKRRAHAAFEALNRSEIQEKLRAERAWFGGVVYWNPADQDIAELKSELRRIADTGFNLVRFHTCEPVPTGPGRFDFARTDDWMAAAAEVGIAVVLHVGLGQPDDATIEAAGLDRERFELSWFDDERSRDCLASWMEPVLTRYREHPTLFGYELMGEPSPGLADIDNPADRARFAAWLEARYGTVDALNTAWTLYPRAGQPLLRAFSDAADVLLAGVRAGTRITGVHRAKINYGAARDMVRYLTDRMLSRVTAMRDVFKRFDDRHAVLLGSHQLFANQSALRWDTMRYARLGDVHFSSIHMSWHFEQVDGEIDRPVYMQARLTRDAFKNGFTSCYETTGGAVQYSGGYGNAMTPGLMRRLIMSYIAAGNLSVAFWTWNHRPGFWEAGEYGLTTLSGRVAPWGEEAGKVCRALGRYADELWTASGEPHVGLLESWDTDAIYLLEPERHDAQDGHGQFSRGTQMQAIRARIGAARALIDAQIPFEYVAPDELRAGIAARYPVIYCPHVRSVSDELLACLTAYVEAGGRLVADVQFGFMDPWGKLRTAGASGPVARLFGAWLDTIHDARTSPMSIGGHAVTGLFGDIVTCDARAIARFSDGRPAATERAVGRGSAVLLASDAGRECWKPPESGGTAGGMQGFLTDILGANRVATWRCSVPTTYRLSSEAADHYFIVNDGPAVPAFLNVSDRRYTRCTDAIEHRDVPIGATMSFDVAERSALWLRMERGSRRE